MKVAITGSSGFVGSNFIRQVTDFQIKEVDLLTQNVDDIDFSSVDSVLHLAALVHQMKSAPDELFFKVNRDLAIEVAKRAKEQGVKHFIQMSTIAVYGEQQNITINSNVAPLNAYGKSKFEADEEILKMQNDSFKVTIVRPPMIYGGGNAPGNMMRLIRFADNGIPLPFKGVNNKRDFININNLVQILEIIIRRQLKGIYLLSENQSISTEFLLKFIENNLGKKVPVFKIPSILLYTIKKIRPKEYQKLFGSSVIETNFEMNSITEIYTIDQGIAEMVAWYKKTKTKPSTY